MCLTLARRRLGSGSPSPSPPGARPTHGRSESDSDCDACPPTPSARPHRRRVVPSRRLSVASRPQHDVTQPCLLNAPDSLRLQRRFGHVSVTDQRDRYGQSVRPRVQRQIQVSPSSRSVVAPLPGHHHSVKSSRLSPRIVWAAHPDTTITVP